MLKFAWLKRAVVAVIGFTVLLIGVAMVVLPGPAVVVIPLGLAILATEFVWAQRLLEKAKATITRKKSRKNGEKSIADDPTEGEQNGIEEDEGKRLSWPGRHSSGRSRAPSRGRGRGDHPRHPNDDLRD
jgi:tellurite resistance protein TerC